MLERLIQKEIAEWLLSPRRKPLILRGARQVGKSTLVQTCAAENGRRLLTINCERHRQLDAVFETLNMARICAYRL